MTAAKSKPLQDQIQLAQSRLYDKIVSLDIGSLNISEYNQRYLGGKKSELKNALQLYGRLIHLSLADNRIPLEEFVFVDYGGGSGLISCLAAELGVGTVIYNDIYDVSCTDVEHLSDALGLKLGHIVSGDIDELVAYLNKNAISVDVITSYDVLEHIYNVEAHFKDLARLHNKKFRIVYASGANIANPRYVSAVKKTQIRVELHGKDKKWGFKERDTARAYLDVRKEMISAYAPDMDSATVEQLARSTRGLIKQDIEKCVDEFLLQGSIAYQIDHDTNTCDPNTGNWCEHLMEFEWLEQVLKSAGFSVEILPGRYSTMSESLPKKGAKKLINAAIRLLNRKGMFIAPYYVVYGKLAESTPAKGKMAQIGKAAKG